MTRHGTVLPRESFPKRGKRAREAWTRKRDFQELRELIGVRDPFVARIQLILSKKDFWDDQR